MKEQVRFPMAGILLFMILTGLPIVSAADLSIPVVPFDGAIPGDSLIYKKISEHFGDVVLSAQNSRSGTGIAVTRSGTVLVTGTNGSVAMQHSGIGRPGIFHPALSGTAGVGGARVDIIRQGYSEWYQINDAGIEQGMTLMNRPEGSGNLTITFSLGGDLKPDSVGQTLIFSDVYGPVIYYGGLAVRDATGRQLPAELTLSGTQLVWNIDDTDAIYPVTIDPYITTQVASFNSPASLNNGRFGVSVSVWNDTMLIGEDGASSGGFQYAGQAHVYQKNGGSWHYATNLSPPNPSLLLRFGSSVSIFNDTAVVGASLADSSGVSDAGEAYVFRYSENSWNLVAYLNASDKTPGAGFGSSVSVNGDLIAVGAPSAYVNGKSAGQVYIFTNSGGAWTQTANISSPDEVNSIGFGSSVSLDNDSFVAGSYLAPTGSAVTAPGRAYVYTRSGEDWSRVANLSAWTNQSANARFGSSVSLDNDTIVVGAMYADPGGVSNAGQAYVFKKSGGVWTSDTALVASDRTSSAYFGSSVSLRNKIAVIGAYQADPPGIYDGGQAYAFENSGGSWIQVAKFSASDEQEGDGFGKAISVYDTTVAAGAPFATVSSTTLAGKVYIFDLTEPILAPTVIGISPSSGVNTSDVIITDLIGTGFITTGTTEVRLTRSGFSNISATATVESSERITCILPITGVEAGSWNVVVINPDGHESSETVGFEIQSPSPAPIVIDISPSAGINNGPVVITNLTGTNFSMTSPGTTVWLNRTGSPDIVATGVTVESATKITCVFNLTGASAGRWNVMVTNPDGQSGVGEDLFTITSPTPTITATVTPTPVPTSPEATLADDSNTGPSVLTGAAVTVTGIQAGSTGTFSFPMTCSDMIPLAIIRIQIVPYRDLEETTVTIAQSSGSLAEVRGLPVAGYEEIEIVGVSNTAIREGSIMFVLDGSWLDEHHLDLSSIVMMREDDGIWKEVPTDFLYERDDQYYFIATTPGFSIFAVTVHSPVPALSAGSVLNAALDPVTTEIPVTTETKRSELSLERISVAGSYVPTDTIPTSADMVDPPRSSESPFVLIALTALCAVAITIWGIVIHRWWRRRQNPALFRKYD